MATDKPKGSNKMPPSTAEGHVMSRQVLLRMLSTLALLGRLRPEAHASSLLSGGLTPMLIAGASHAGSSLAIPGPEHHTGAARLDYAYPGLASWAHNTSGLSPLQISQNRPCWMPGIDGLPAPPLWGVTATHLSCRFKLPTLAATMFRQRQYLDTLSVRAARETGLTSDTDPSVFAHPNRWASWCHGGTRPFCSSLCLGRSPAHRTWTPWTEALPGPLWHLICS